ncbi:MAG: L,D-transpeptidase family protein [Planctomycetota bacterium]
MQTIKTAAIVVLMTVILYGAFVSMTTPPDALPPEVESLIVDSGDFDINDGLADDFGQMSLSMGDLADLPSPDALATSEGNPSAQAIDLMGPTGGNPVAQNSEFNVVDNSYADIPPAGAGASPTPSFTLSDETSPDTAFHMSDSEAGALTRLPTTNGQSARIEGDPDRAYATTGQDMAVPEPKEILVESDATPEATTSAIDQLGMGGSDSVTAAGLENAIATADRQYLDDRRRDALATLSLFYETPNLTEAQRNQLLTRLDPLAREVIYSKEHLLEKPHRVGNSETLMEIASSYDVPWQLLANINGVDDPVAILPGTDLKVVRGPFRADVDRQNQELTLFLGDLYAGRFPIAIGSDPEPSPGTYTIQEKKNAKTYYDLSGTPVPPGNPRNPYGTMWIDLGSGLSIHGSPKPDSPTSEGCISVAGNYSRDLYGILSEGSSVTIR